MEIVQNLYTAMRFDFLYADRYVFPRGWVYPKNHVPYCMVRLIEKGEAIFVINDKIYHVQEGEIIYIPEGCTLYCETDSEEFIFISIRFRLTAQLHKGDFLSDYYLISTKTRILDEDNLVKQYFYEVWHGALSQSKSKIFCIRGNLELIIAWLVEHGGADYTVENTEEIDEEYQYSLSKALHREEVTSERSQDPRIAALIDYITVNISKNLSARELADMAGMSESSMRRLFIKHTGKTPIEFIQDNRLVVAARRLLVTNERISQIAYSVGYDNPNYFTRIFKKNFGVSPQQYRKRAE